MKRSLLFASLATALLLPSAALAATRANISQITKTKWFQRTPYNDLCKDADGNESASGCVPTAMSQIMKVHAWPTTGRGTHTDKYQSNLTADFGATTYQWSSMYNSYTSALLASSVQKLILHAGISVDVIYKGSAGSSYAEDTPYAFGEYFKYDKSSIQYIMRDYCSPEEWEDIIYGELAAGRPVLYSGHNSNEGHSFICDGYQNGNFIFNLGWGTSPDPNGATLVSSFDGLQWPDQQTAVIGIKPDQTANASTEWRNPRLWGINVSVTTTSSYIRVSQRSAYGTDGIYVKGAGEFPANSRIGLKFLPLSGGEPVYFSNTFGGTSKQRGMTDYETSINWSRLGTGKYRVTLCYSYGPDGDWMPIRLPYSQTQAWIYDGSSKRYLAADNDYKLPGLMNEAAYAAERNDGAQLTLVDLSVPNDQLKSNLKANATLKGTGGAFYGDLTLKLFNEDGTTELASSTQTVSIGEGVTKTIEYSFNFDKGTDGMTYTAQLYNNETKEAISGFVPFILADQSKPTPVEVNFSMKSYEVINTYSNNYDMKIYWVSDDMTLQKPELYLYTYTWDGTLFNTKREVPWINNGAGTSSISLGSLSDNYYYGIVYLNNNGVHEPITRPLYFTIGTPTGVDELPADDVAPEDAEDQWFDLQGVPVAEPQPGGIYIRLRDGRATKHRF